MATEGDVYLADAGLGYPSFYAISLDIPDGGSSPVYHESFQSYRYVRKGTTFFRQHKIKDGKTPARFRLAGDWYIMYDFTLEEFDEEEIQNNIDQGTYSNFDTHFNKNINVVVWKGARAVAIKDNLLMVEDNSGEWVTSELETGNAIVQAVREHFPTIPDSVVFNGVSNWCLQSEAGSKFQPPSQEGVHMKH